MSSRSAAPDPDADPDAAERLTRVVGEVRAAGRSAVARLRPVPGVDTPAIDGLGTAAARTGMEDPRELAAEIPLVERAFAFVDLCGFTRYTSEHGEHAAIDALHTFRTLTRDIATRRGVRVAKWLGDGAMLVGVDVGPTIATAAELMARYDVDALPLRGGIAHGRVLLFEADDYIGRPANLAARLCESAPPYELLAVGYPADALPPWIRVLGVRDLTLKGLGRIRRVQRLAPVDGVELPALSTAAPAPHVEGVGG